MEFLISQFNGLVGYVAPFFILLGVLIFVHEFGHFIVARICGVRVEVFSLGFGKKILKFKGGDTQYCLSLIPLGGYVKMFGDDPSKDVSESEKHYSFLHQPVLARMAIVAAGPLINLLFAIVVFAAVATLGEKFPLPKVGDVDSAKAAYSMGFRSGDTVKSVDGQPVRNWEDVSEQVKQNPGRNLSFVVEREGSLVQESIVARPTLSDNENILSSETQVGRIEGLGIYALAAVIGVKDKSSIAYKAGLRPLDVVDSINEQKIEFFRQIEPALAKAGSAVTMNVSSYDNPQNKREIKFTLTPEQKPTLEAIGIENSELYLGKVAKNSPAERAGLKPGDRILSVQGQVVRNWEDILAQVKSFDPNQTKVDIEVWRDGEKLAMHPKPEMNSIMNGKGQEEHRYAVGIVPALAMINSGFVVIRSDNFFEAARTGFKESMRWTHLTLMSFLRLIENKVSPRNIGGVLTIGRVAAQSFELGISEFLKMMGIISINLFILNLLPVPVLDGGHLVFFSIEALRGAPLSLRKMEIAQTVGLVILMSLMVFAFYNDINNWISASGW